MILLLIIMYASIAGLAWILFKMIMNLAQIHNITFYQVYHKYIKRPVCKVHIKALKIRRNLTGLDDPHATLRFYAKEKVEEFGKYCHSGKVEDSMMGSEDFRRELLKAKLLELKARVADYLPETGRLRPADIYWLELFRKELRMLGWTPEPVDKSKMWIKK
jgi:hypothetical protein